MKPGVSSWLSQVSDKWTMISRLCTISLVFSSNFGCFYFEYFSIDSKETIVDLDCVKNHSLIQKTRIFFILNLLIRYSLHLLRVPLLHTILYLSEYTLTFSHRKKNNLITGFTMKICTRLMKAIGMAAILLRAGLRLQRQKELYYFLIWWVLDSPASRLSHILYDLSTTMNQTQKLVHWSSSTVVHSPKKLGNFHVMCQYLLSFLIALFNSQGRDIWSRSRAVPITSEILLGNPAVKVVAVDLFLRIHAYSRAVTLVHGHLVMCCR